MVIDASLPEKLIIELAEFLEKHIQIPLLIFSLKNEKNEKVPNTGDLLVDSLTITEQSSGISNRLVQAQKMICSNSNLTKQGEYRYTLFFGDDLIIEPEKRQVYLKGKKLRLTRKEYDMLLCFANNAGKVLTREQLYKQIWETDTSYNIDELVKAHIKTLRKKLSDADIQYIKNVWGVGYRFDHETEEDGE